MNIQVKEVAYHRNGVAGEGFYVVRFSYTDDDGVAHPNMVGIVFGGRGRVAILDADMAAAGNVAFAKGNSWRGDQFEDDLREAADAYEESDRKTFQKPVAPRNALAEAIATHDKGLDKVAVV